MPNRDYPKIILSQLKQIFHNPRHIKDPNVEINHYLKKSERGNWYPPFLFKSAIDGYAMIKPFKSDYFSDKECNEDIHNARLLMGALGRHSIKSKVFYIAETTEDMERLIKLNPPKEIGVIYIGDDVYIDPTIREAFLTTCKLCPEILKYLSSCKNLEGKIGDTIRRFSKEYLTKKPNNAAENSMISEFKANLLNSGQKHNVNAKYIELIKKVEAITGNSREHYFHSYNTMMLGFMIIDKIYSLFKKIIYDKYGKDINLEHLWVLTSLFHDIGYAESKLNEVMSEIYNVEPEENEELLGSRLKQIRKDQWEKAYPIPVDILNDLFRHVNKQQAKRWDYDGFPRPKVKSAFKDALQTAYLENASHGTAGAIRMIQLTIGHLEKISNTKDRKCFIRHYGFASLAILLHDPSVRQCLRNKSIKNVKAIDFPLAALLVYADILQDERRNLTGTISRPDLISDVIVHDNKIIARLNKPSLTDSQKRKILLELKEAFSFLVMNGISFISPEELA